MSARTDVIPSEVEEPAVSTPPNHTQPTTTNPVIASEREEPAVPSSAQPPQPEIPNHRQKSPKQQQLEDIYYGRIPAPADI